jgi:hypothetical protein
MEDAISMFKDKPKLKDALAVLRKSKDVSVGIISGTPPNKVLLIQEDYMLIQYTSKLLGLDQSFFIHPIGSVVVYSFK